MVKRTRPDLRKMVHPYMFVLREGSAIKDDLLDFSLMMFHVSAPEVIKSPPPLKLSPDRFAELFLAAAAKAAEKPRAKRNSKQER